MLNDGRIITSSGVILLAQAERRLGLASKLTVVTPNRRDSGADRAPFRPHSSGAQLRNRLRR